MADLSQHIPISPQDFVSLSAGDRELFIRQCSEAFSDALKSGQHDKAWSLGKELWPLFEIPGVHLRTRLTFYSNFASLALVNGDASLADKLAAKGLVLAKGTNLEFLMIPFLYIISKAASARGDSSSQLAYLQEAANLSINFGEKQKIYFSSVMIKVYDDLAKLHDDAGRHLLAARNFERKGKVEAADAQVDRRDALDSFWLAAQVYFDLHDYENSERVYTKMLEYILDFGLELPLQLKIRTNIIFTRALQFERDGVYLGYRDLGLAYRDAKLNDGEFALCRARATLGVVQAAEGNFDRGLRMVQAAREVEEKHTGEGDGNKVAGVITSIYSAANAHTPARRNYEQACLRLYEKVA